MDNDLKIITLTKDNIADEHICCAFSDKKSIEGYNKKKTWLKLCFEEEFVFKKYNIKHKVFIEYVPAENAWFPVNAPGYMFINCFWVAGRWKGQGLGKNLLNECIEDSKGKNGIIVISSSKKRPFLNDKKFFLKNGFEVCDTAPPYFELLVRKNNPDAPDPEFNESAKTNKCDNQNGLTAYYSDQCPFNEYYVNNVLKEAAEYHNIPLEIIHVDSKENAQSLPTAFTYFSLFYDGEFITHELMTRKSFDKFWDNQNAE